MALEKYEIETSYAASGQIIIKIGNPEGDLTYDNPRYHHGQPIGTQPDEGGDHVTVMVKALDPPNPTGDLVFEDVEMFLDPNSDFYEVVSVATTNSSGSEVEINRKRNKKVSVNSSN